MPLRAGRAGAPDGSGADTPGSAAAAAVGGAEAPHCHEQPGRRAVEAAMECRQGGCSQRGEALCS